MYLDFISDIAKKGDVIRITCKNEEFEGMLRRMRKLMTCR